MAGITLAQAQSQLDAYLAAEIAVLSGQEYTIAGRRLVRADLANIQAGIRTWSAKVEDLTLKASGSSRAIRMRPGW